MQCCICKEGSEDDKKEYFECMGTCGQIICLQCLNNLKDESKWTDARSPEENMTLEDDDEDYIICPSCFQEQYSD